MRYAIEMRRKLVTPSSGCVELTPHTESGCPINFPCVHGICENTSTAAEHSRLECLCESGWVGRKCDHCCALDCDHGICLPQRRVSALSDRNQTEIQPLTGLANSTVCQCDWGYRGETCSEENPPGLLQNAEDATFHQWLAPVVILSISILLILTFAMVVWYLWRRKVALVMRLVEKYQRWFRVSDKELHKYDAFVSYSCEQPDATFVMKQLYPRLEKRAGMTLCLHERDFTPGEAIANNIIGAVTSSKHTILVLSPRFIQSEWTRFEYQVAQFEMLRLRHRIVPIMFEDISSHSITDPNLTLILKTVTYVRWPATGSEREIDAFWEKLCGAMQ